MDQWRKNVILLWIAIFIASVCWTMVMPFMPVFLENDLGLSVGVMAWAGLLGAVNSGFNALMAPVWGAMGDRFGRKPMMLRAGLALTLAYFLMSLVSDPYQLLGVRVMIGVLTGFIPTAIALVGTTTPQEHVGKALSLVATANQSGAILGPLLGGVLADLIGLRASMVASSALIALATALVLFAVKEQFTPVQRESGNLLTDMGEVLRNPSFAAVLVATVIMMASQAAMEPVLVPYIKELLGDEAPNWMAGAIYSLPGIAFILAAPWWAHRAERLGYTTTVSLGLFLGAAAILPQALVSTGWTMGALRLSAGLALAAVGPGISALITLVVPRSQRGRAFGLNQSAFAIGAMLGPLLGGMVGDWAGTAWVFPVTALLLALGGVWTRFVLDPRIRREPVTDLE
ncbi:MAG: MFS transporter [Bacillota bacterium]